MFSSATDGFLWFRSYCPYPSCSMLSGRYVIDITGFSRAHPVDTINAFAISSSNWPCGAGPIPVRRTARKPWMSISTRVARYKHRHNTITVSLYDILDIDTRRCVVRVEPLVTIGQLTRRLVPLGWTLPIVPELDDLMVSGLLLGYGIESSSHKYGLFAVRRGKPFMHAPPFVSSKRLRFGIAPISACMR